MTLQNARLCIRCDLVLDGVRCECGNTALIALHSLVKPDELRAEIALARRPVAAELPEAVPS